jgi:hypothetical protein
VGAIVGAGVMGDGVVGAGVVGAGVGGPAQVPSVSGLNIDIR